MSSTSSVSLQTQMFEQAQQSSVNTSNDNTYNIPNDLNIPDVEFGLYVQYPNGYWNKFVLDQDNSHQLAALQEFIKSGEQTKQITVPHPHGGVFVANFSQRSDDQNYNKIYSYIRENGTSVKFMVSYNGQIGNINRLSSEPCC
jgi:hypothetical protein